MPELTDTRFLNLPLPKYPIPVTEEFFPLLPALVRGQTRELHRKLDQLSFYNVYPGFDTIIKGFAARPETIQPDANEALALFQSFDRNFPERENAEPDVEMLAFVGGEVQRLKWEGVSIGQTFNVLQFQTAKFLKGNSQLYTDEKAMFPLLGFFNWKAVCVEYFEQAIKFLQVKGAACPDYISVSLWRKADMYHQFHVVGQFPERYSTLESKIALAGEIVKKNKNIFRQIGYELAGDGIGGPQVFKDIRDIEPVQAFQAAFASRL